MTIFDRIKDTSTTSGTALGATATFTVSGTAPSGYQTFSARFAVNDANIPVVISHQSANEWQVCWCTYTTTNTLRVDTVIFSSNGDAGVNFSAGTKDVFVSASSRAFGGIRETNVWTGNNTFPNTGLKVQDTDASHVLTLASGALTANRTLTLTTGSAADRTLDISAANVTISTAGAALIDDATTLAQQQTLGAFDTVAAVNAAAVDSSVNHIRTAGYYASGDGGGALYKRIATPSPVKAYHITSNGGTIYWELAEPMPNVLMLGAKGDGSTDDSAAFQNTLTYATDKGRYHVFIPSCTTAAQTYRIKNVDISGGVTVYGYGAYIVDTGLTGVNYIFKVSGYNTTLMGVQISSALNCSASNAAILLEDGFRQTLRDVAIINAVNGVKVAPTAGNSNQGFTIDNLRVNTFSGKGLWLAARAEGGNIQNVYCDAGQESGTGGYRPKTGSTGFLLDGTGSGSTAFGGHQFTSCLTINTQVGFDIALATLSNFTNIQADNCSGAGIRIGNASPCSFLQFNTVFIGYCGRAIDVLTGGSYQTSFYSLTTHDTGVIPSGGGTDYYSFANAYSSPWYDIAQAGTSFVTINTDNWSSTGTNAYEISEATVGNIQTLGGIIIPFNSVGTVAAASTVYMNASGQSATEIDRVYQTQKALYHRVIAARVFADSDIAPGAGQSFTYTLRNNFADSAITGTSSGAGSYSATMSGASVTINPYNNISMKLVTSATAAAARHRGYIQLFVKAS